MPSALIPAPVARPRSGWKRGALVSTPTDQAAAVLKENFLKVPENMEFEIPQLIGPEVWQTLDRSSRVTFGKQVKREAAEFGLEFVRTTVSRHAVYKKRVVVG